jgi:hypothetical protein
MSLWKIAQRLAQHIFLNQYITLTVKRQYKNGLHLYFSKNCLNSTYVVGPKRVWIVYALPDVPPQALGNHPD